MLPAFVAIALLAAGSVERAADGTSTSADPIRLTVAATGDFLIHEPVWERAFADGGRRRYDFRRMLRFVRPIVRRADIGLSAALHGKRYLLADPRRAAGKEPGHRGA